MPKINYKKLKNAAKKIVFSLAPLMLLLIVAEILVRIAFFQKTADEPFALKLGYRAASEIFLRKRAEQIVEELRSDPSLRAQNQELLKKTYEYFFSQFLDETKKAQARLLVIYLPSDQYDGVQREIMQDRRAFYKELTQKYNVDFIDLAPAFLEYPSDIATLLPQNGHLSRFGNKLVVRELSRYIEINMDEIQSKVSYSPSERPKIMGFFEPNDDYICRISPVMPYRVITNKQGLRMEHDLEFPKTKKRILCLGDSFTFGPYLDNHDTFPQLLGAKYPQFEVINGGISSYTISDELKMFQEKTKYVEPDLVILQVLDNDIGDLQKEIIKTKAQTFQK
ncbi:MAG: hypothetical protein ABIC19_03640 [Patescibacteria group bacterium]|nr:SGNH/GDSL hydrolase family protein [Patescibacteria group bacterium]